MEAPYLPPSPPADPRDARGRTISGWPGIPIGRILGLDIRIDISWLFIFALVAMSLFGYFSRDFPEARTGALWVAALSTAVLFFACLLLHEISHSLVARARGVDVSGITLFMFGGVSQLREEPRRPSDEFMIALVGPAVSALVGLVFLAFRYLFPADTITNVACGWLGWINIALAVFNLLPGFPLDGGRILRAVIWGATKDFRQATHAASFMGSVIAFGLVLWGILAVLLGGRFIDGLWLGLIGWFILVASRNSVGQMELRESLTQLRVAQALRASCPMVRSDLSLESFVEQFLFKGGGKCYFVTDGDRLLGLATLDDVRRVKREDWPHSAVSHVMTPLNEIQSVRTSDSLLVAFERMNEHSLNQLPVVEDGHVRGVITRNDIFRLVARYLELTEHPARA